MRADQVRGAVLEIYEQVRREGARADQALQRVIRREKQLRSVERRAVSDAVYGLLRLQGRVDHLLGRALGTRKLSLAGLATPTQHLLRYAAWLVLSEGASAASAAGLGGPEVAPFVWVLELVARPEESAQAAEANAADPLGALAARCSLPRWLASLWRDQLGDGETLRLAEALNQRAPLTLRTNTLKGSRAALEAALAQDGVPTARTPYSPLGLQLTSRTNVFALKAFKAGLFEVQDEGSQLIAQACGVRPGQLVVDACAGAGGKTLALAAAMENKGRLVACDRDGRRLQELKLRARRAGAHNWEARTVNEGPSGEARIADLAGKADVVLVDAPCSGLGALRRNPDARWRLDQAEVDSFPPRQLEIGRRYAALVRPGGLLLYATCSINRRENEDVREALLLACPGLEPVDPRELLGPELCAALGSAGLPAPASREVPSPPAPDPSWPALGARPVDVQLAPERHGTDGFYLAGLIRRR